MKATVAYPTVKRLLFHVFLRYAPSKALDGFASEPELTRWSVLAPGLVAADRVAVRPVEAVEVAQAVRRAGRTWSGRGARAVRALAVCMPK